MVDIVLSLGHACHIRCSPSGQAGANVGKDQRTAPPITAVAGGSFHTAALARQGDPLSLVILTCYGRQCTPRCGSVLP